MRRLGLFLSWLLATTLVTVVAFRVVGAAESQVGDAPLTPVVAITDPSASDDPTTLPTTTTTSPTTTTTTRASVSSGGGTSTTTTTPPTTTVPGSTTTTTGSTTTTRGSPTTSEAAAGWVTLNIPTDGGTLTVEHRPGEIRLVAATAQPGYRVGDIEPGPPEVEVEFERGDSEIDVRVRWSDDGPSVEITADD